MNKTTQMKNAFAWINTFKSIEEPSEDDNVKKEQAVNLYIEEARELMTGIKKAQLVDLANELSDMMEINNPPLKTTGNIGVVLAEVVEAGTLLESGDTLSDEAIAILDQLGLRDFMDYALIEIPEPERDDAPEEPGEELVDEQTEDEYGPDKVQDQEDPPMDDFDGRQDREREPDDVVIESDTVVEPILGKGSLDGIDIDALADILIKKGIRASKIRRKIGTPENPSSYMEAVTMLCKYPDLSYNEVCQLLVKETSVQVLDKETRPGILTAHSLVRKIVRLLRENGHMPKQIIKPTAKKNVAKK